jgi:hypothetical protein
MPHCEECDNPEEDCECEPEDEDEEDNEWLWMRQSRMSKTSR